MFCILWHCFVDCMSVCRTLYFFMSVLVRFCLFLFVCVFVYVCICLFVFVPICVLVHLFIGDSVDSRIGVILYRFIDIVL
jgi:hypothetical protein